MSSYSIVVENKAVELNRISEFLETIVTKYELSQKIAFELNLVMEEYFINLVNYAYREGEEDQIRIRLTMDEPDGMVSVFFCDKGKSFDILGYTDKPNTEIPIAERKPGGWGIELIKSLVDSLEYTAGNEENRLRITKQIK